MATHSSEYTSVDLHETFAVVQPERRLMGGAETDEFEAILRRANADALKFVVVDMVKLDFMNSGAIGVLMRAQNDFTRRRGEVLLARVDRRLLDLFAMLKCAFRFRFFPTVEAAIAAGEEL